MNGMEILNEVTQMPERANTEIIACTVLGIALAFVAAACAYAIVRFFLDASFDITDWKDWVCLILLIAIIVAASVGSIKLFCKIPDMNMKRETIVYATIDDTVPWTEINEKYELIRQDGKIYQLRVKEEEK